MEQNKIIHSVGFCVLLHSVGGKLAASVLLVAKAPAASCRILQFRRSLSNCWLKLRVVIDCPYGACCAIGLSGQHLAEHGVHHAQSPLGFYNLEEYPHRTDRRSSPVYPWVISWIRLRASLRRCWWIPQRSWSFLWRT